jgi:hypothetical protein
LGDCVKEKPVMDIKLIFDLIAAFIAGSGLIALVQFIRARHQNKLDDVSSWKLLIDGLTARIIELETDLRLRKIIETNNQRQHERIFELSKGVDILSNQIHEIAPDKKPAFKRKPMTDELKMQDDQ